MSALPSFDRRFLNARERFTRIGSGGVGGKAQGLLFMNGALAGRLDPPAFPAVRIEVPTFTVIGADLFDRFVEQNGLGRLAEADEPDDRIAHAFQQAELPADLVGDLRALVEQVRSPLAIRSSSLLEDALHEPFAGVYGTKMIPNNQPDPDARFRKLVDAVKYVYASTWFGDGRAYRLAVGRRTDDEKMAVLIQEVVGRRHGDRFYPDVSGVARSFSYYRAGGARPEDGVVILALGLGRTIVDDGLGWSYSPAAPRAAPPFAGPGELLERTQLEFWAVNMGRPPAYDPMNEVEYLVKAGLDAADADGTLRHIASTYDPRSDRLSPGVGATGPRVLNFAPLLVLETWPLNDVVRALIALCEEAVGSPVEIEFAVTFDTPGQGQARLGFLQVRPLTGSLDTVEVPTEALRRPEALVASYNVLGNGIVSDVRDIVYVPPDRFDRAQSARVAAEVGAVNARLLAERRRCLLIGLGRWGSSDPWLGIPAAWSQVAAARAIVEAPLPGLRVEPSQGAHFFHNLSSFGVSYFCLDDEDRIDWDWIAGQEPVSETAFVRHVRSAAPLAIRVDGRTGRGVILRGLEENGVGS